MTPAERTLLLAVFRWAHAEVGLLYGRASTWTAMDGSWGVASWPEDWEAGDPASVEVWRAGLSCNSLLWVTSIAEAVDGLVALGILPHRFSTAYRAGYDARTRARIAASASTLGWNDPAIETLVPAADRVLVVGR